MLDSLIIPGKTKVRLKYDHPTAGCDFLVVGHSEARGFYQLAFSYQVDSISKFKIRYSVIAHEDEFEIVE